MCCDLVAGLLLSGITNGQFVPSSHQAGGSDFFTLGMKTDGSQLWAHQFGGLGTEQMRADGVIQASDGQGNHYIVGYTDSDTNSWDSGDCTNCAGGDVVVIKYSSTGQQLWIRRHGSNRNDYPRAVVVSQDGRVFVSGNTYGLFPGAVCDGPCGDMRMSVFVAEVDPEDGNMIWTMQFVGNDPVPDDGDAFDIFDQVLMVDNRNSLYVSYGRVYNDVFKTYVRKIQPGSRQHIWEYTIGHDAWVKSGLVLPNKSLWVVGSTTTALRGRNGAEVPLPNSGANGFILQINTANGRFSSLSYHGVTINTILPDNTRNSMIVAGWSASTTPAPAFVASIHQQGRVVWEQVIHGGGLLLAQLRFGSLTAAIDDAGAVYTMAVFVGEAGSISGVLSFSKFAPKTGNRMWTTDIATPLGHTQTHSVLLDGAGGLYGVGFAKGAFPDTGHVTADDKYEVWVVKLVAEDGERSWLKQIGSGLESDFVVGAGLL